jgi:phosphoenolpyruvate-protein phosphotransferase
VLDDPELLAATASSIGKGRQNAALAWDGAVRRIIESYGRLKDEYLRQRVADVSDISARVLEALGVPRTRVGDLPSPGILVVEDLTPAEVTALASHVTGVICLQGAATSHAAILLRARGIPAIARAQRVFERAALDRSAHGKAVAALDGDSGELWLNPEPSKLVSLRELQERRRLSSEEESSHRHEAALTTDSGEVAVFANLGQVAEAANALDRGAEGVGLFRTEFLFLDRAAAPAEDEQYAALRELRDVMGTRPVVIRTLDIGGDKEVPYLGLPKEANPFLGVRGIRLCLSHPDIFQPHLRAILRAGHGGEFRLMFPMIADLAELIDAKAALEEAHRSLDRDSVLHAWPIPVGIMIEVPSAALLADQLAAHADFFSIGTNDLTQYVLAADRGNAELARYHNAMHPSVLRLIQQVADAAHRHGRHVAVCGEAAGDADAARILIGFGVDELSITPVRIPAIKAAIRAASIAELKLLATRALTPDSSSADAPRAGE